MTKKGESTLDTIEAKDERIDVQEIMKQIRAEIKAKRAKGIITEDIDEKLRLQLIMQDVPPDIKSQLREMNARWHVSAEKPIYSDRLVIGPVTVFIKRAIRKVLRWYVNDVTEQVSGFNMHAVWAISEIESRLTKLEECVRTLEKGKSAKEQVRKEQ